MEQVVECGHRLLLHRNGYVGVEVEGDADLAVTEHLADDLRMDA